MGQIFRAKFIEQLEFEGLAVPDCVWEPDWVIDARHVGNGSAALKYLAQYVFRVAISPSRILNVTRTHVHFKYRRSGEKKWRVCKLELFEFMRRYLQHVLPHGFTKVRHYGFMSANAKVPLQKIRELICRLYEVIKEMLPEVPPPRKKPWICRNCGGTIRWRALERSGKIISEGNSEAVHLFHALGALDKKKTHPLHHKSRLVLHETTVFVLKTEPNPYVEIS